MRSQGSWCTAMRMHAMLVLASLSAVYFILHVQLPGIRTTRGRTSPVRVDGDGGVVITDGGRLRLLRVRKSGLNPESVHFAHYRDILSALRECALCIVREVSATEWPG